MPSLEKRIAELEKSASQDELSTTVIIRTLLPDAGPKQEIQELHDRRGQQRWIRYPGETEQNLIDRASREATSNGVTCALLMGSDCFTVQPDVERSARVRETAWLSSSKDA